jgi:hypothetical protein
MDKNTLLDIANKGCYNLKIWVYSEYETKFSEKLQENLHLTIFRLSVTKSQYILFYGDSIVFQENKSAISFWNLCEYLGLNN